MKLTIDRKFFESLTYSWQLSIYEAVLQVYEDRVVFEAADKSVTVFQRTEIPAEKFDAFDPAFDQHEEHFNEEKERLEIGVIVENLYSILKALSSDDVTFDLDGSMLVVRHESGKMSLPILSLDMDDIEGMDFDKLESDTHLEVTRSEFEDAFDQLSIVGAPIKFIAKDNESDLYLSAEGNQAEVDVNISSSIRPEASSTTWIAQDFVKDVRKALKKLPDTSEELRLSYSEDMPLVVKPTTEGYTQKWFIAPRIPEGV